jgi:hypothetical protein
VVCTFEQSGSFDTKGQWGETSADVCDLMVKEAPNSMEAVQIIDLTLRTVSQSMIYSLITERTATYSSISCGHGIMMDAYPSEPCGMVTGL